MPPRAYLFSPSTVSSIASTRSKLGREDIKWAELLQHFRTVQNKHEKARRPALGTDDFTPMAEFSTVSNTAPSINGAGSRPPLRRKGTGADSAVSIQPGRPPSRALSPLNPRARQSGLSAALSGPQPPTSPTSALSMAQQQKSKRTLSVSRTK